MSAPLLGDQGVVLCFSRPICPEHLRNEMLSSSVRGRRRMGWKDRPGSLAVGAVAIGRGQVASVAPLWTGSADGTPGAELVLGDQMLSLGQSRACKGRWPELGRNSLPQPRVQAWPQRAALPASAAWGLAHSAPPPVRPSGGLAPSLVPFSSPHQLSPFPGAPRQPEPGKRRPRAGGGVVGKGRRAGVRG